MTHSQERGEGAVCRERGGNGQPKAKKGRKGGGKDS